MAMASRRGCSSGPCRCSTRYLVIAGGLSESVVRRLEALDESGDWSVGAARVRSPEGDERVPLRAALGTGGWTAGLGRRGGPHPLPRVARLTACGGGADGPRPAGADKQPDLYDRAAVRWLGRLLLEQPDLGLDDAGVALAALDQLAQWPATAKVLARMVDH
jgi:hypothetical protein